MPDILSLACLPAALFVLLRLCVIDLQIRLLPNPLVLALAVLGLTFHAATLFYYAPPQDLLIGALIGGGSLLLIRTIGNYIYKDDTLGLGDVKLLAAEGLWLGADDTILALVFGAVAGLAHGLFVLGLARYKKQETQALSTFSIPAGPGFIVGFVIVALEKFWGLPHLHF